MSQSILRPVAVCKALLTALEASEGRRRSRKRDQTPDGIGLTFKRELLEQAVSDDPEPEAFEQWLLRLHCHPWFGRRDLRDGQSGF